VDDGVMTLLGKCLDSAEELFTAEVVTGQAF
jgi:hypothetical protein